MIDNCPSHKITIELKQIEILFIPPNQTSIYQPLDQGIIKCFKTIFNGKKLENIIEMIETGKDTFKCYKEISIKDAIILVNFAWSQIKRATISNCFKKAKWIESDLQHENFDDNYSVVFEEFVEKAQIEDPINKDDFLDINFTENDVIIEEFNQDETKFEMEKLACNEEFHSDSENDIIEEKHISDKDCYIALQTIKDYFDQREFTSDAMIGMNYISKALKKRREKFNFDNWIVKRE